MYNLVPDRGSVHVCGGFVMICLVKTNRRVYRPVCTQLSHWQSICAAYIVCQKWDCFPLTGPRIVFVTKYSGLIRFWWD